MKETILAHLSEYQNFYYATFSGSGALLLGWFLKKIFGKASTANAINIQGGARDVVQASGSIDNSRSTTYNAKHQVNIQGDNKGNVTIQTSEEKKTQNLTRKVPDLKKMDDIIGREDELEALHEHFLSGKRQQVLVNGIGGIGKTTLAQAYITKYRAEYAHIAWIDCISDNILQDIVINSGLANRFKMDVRNASPKNLPSLYETLVKDHLDTLDGSPCLLVFDDADDALSDSDLQNSLPTRSKWNILATSRYTISQFHKHTLDLLQSDDAEALFRRHCPNQAITDEQITELVQLVDCHTLAIELLSKTISRKNRTFEQAKTDLTTSTFSANVELGRSNEKVDKIPAYIQRLFTAQALNEQETSLLTHLICLPNTFHTYDNLCQFLDQEQFDAQHGETLFADTLTELKDKGWLQYNQDTNSYKVHAVITDALLPQLQPSPNTVSALITSLTNHLSLDLSNVLEAHTSTWVSVGTMLLERITHQEHEDISCLQIKLGQAFRELGDFKRAKEFIEQALKSNIKNFGRNHPTIVRNFSDLATVLNDLGNSKRAKHLFENVLAFDIQYFGPDHPTTSTSASNLASVLKDLGDYESAKELLEEALESDIENFGPDHPSTAIGYSKLALVLKDLGDYEHAKELLEQALKSDIKNFGPDHPSTIKNASNLATVLNYLCDYESAKALFEQALKSNIKSFGPDHPSIATSYSNLALVLQDLGDYERSQELLEQALALDIKNFGRYHPLTATSYSNLAHALQCCGKYESAKKLFEEALALNISIFGADHTSTAISSVNLGALLKALGRYQERAKELFEEALGVFQAKLPEGHPHIQTTQEHLKQVKNFIATSN